jgi:hypothetical protein
MPKALMNVSCPGLAKGFTALGDSDPVVGNVRAWIAARERQDVMVKRWQSAEHRLSIAARDSELSFASAVDGDLPDAKLMRSLMRQIKSADRDLGRSAMEIAAMRPTTPLGALAKIDMALRIRQPTNDDDHAWMLVDSATVQLRELLQSDPRTALGV